MGATSLHFSNSELQCHCGCNQNLCTQELVDALEALRTLAAKPIHIDSAYRCELHNSALPNAAKHSQHELGNAADIVIEGKTPAEMEELVYRMPVEPPPSNMPPFRGVGRSDHQGYIHVDVRPVDPSLGYIVARWCYDKAGNECAWYPSAVQPGSAVEQSGSSSGS